MINYFFRTVNHKFFDIICLMRERTKLPESLVNKLPNLKLVITSGMWDPII